MADWDTADVTPIPNGYVKADRKVFYDVTAQDEEDITEIPVFDNPAYRDDATTPVPTTTATTTMTGYRKKNDSRSEEHANHLIYDVSKNKPAAINSAKAKTRNSSGGSSSTVVIKRNSEEYGSNRYSEPIVLNVGNLDRPRTQRRHHTVGRNSAHVYYTRSRKQHLQRQYPSGFSTTIKRHAISGETKADCISFFDIETERVDSYQYRPGEEVSGVINVIVKTNVEIRFVELQVLGEGVLTLRRESRDGLPKVTREVYLKRKTCVIGSNDASWTSLLTPGHYTSKFRIKLPPGLPSSLRHEDGVNGFTYEVNYTLIGRVCDDATPTASVRGSTRQGLVQAILSKKVPFYVQRSFDLNTIPGALGPLVNTEQIILSCSHKRPATVTVTVERTVFLAGDDIRLQVAASLPGSQRIKEIECSLQEHLTFGPKRDRLTYTIVKAIQKEFQPAGNALDIAIPTRTDLISSFGLGQGHMRVAYSLDITVRFKPAGGKLFLKVPIGIGPCAEPIYGEKTSTKKVIPVFNRPTRFPTFSPTPHNGAKPHSTASPHLPRSSGPHSPPSPNSPYSPRSPRSPHPQGQNKSQVPVTAKYSNSCLARCFLCCRGISSSDD